jgi:hypothetical protein
VSTASSVGTTASNGVPAETGTTTTAVGSGTASTPQSSTSTVEAGVYVTTYCLTEKRFAEVANDLHRAIDSPSSSKRSKQVVEDALKRATGTGQRLVHDLKAAGTPDDKQGDAFARDALHSFEDLEAAFDKASREAKKLPSGDSAGFQKAVASLLFDLADATKKVGAALGRLDRYATPALDEAAKHDAVCLSLQ